MVTTLLLASRLCRAVGFTRLASVFQTAAALEVFDYAAACEGLTVRQAQEFISQSLVIDGKPISPETVSAICGYIFGRRDEVERGRMFEAINSNRQ